MTEGSGAVNRDNIIFERRRFVRVDGTFVISYTDVTPIEPKSDWSQTKNISLGGILFTTSKKFESGAVLRVKLRLPESPDYLQTKVRVVDSKERAKGILYDTRVKFIGMRDEDRDYIKKIVEYNVQKRNKRIEDGFRE